MTAMSIVLLATDGSDLATAAMARGVELVGKDNDYLALSVVPPAFMPTPAGTPNDTQGSVLDVERELELEREGSTESAAELRELAELLGVDLRSRVEVGEPGDVICDVAAEIHADLIIVGSHGLGWFKRVVIGSVSTHVLHHAPCPVLVVRLAEVGDREA